MKKILPHFLVLLFYSLLTMFLTYPQIRHMKQGIYMLSDQLFYAWTIERNIRAIIDGSWENFYNATIFYPYENTLSFGDHLLGETLLAFPFFIVTDNPVFAVNVLILASFVLSAYGTFLLVRHFTNNIWVAILGGVLFSFSNARFNQYDHLNILSTQWIPFIFLYLQRYLEKWNIRNLIFLFIFYLLTISLTVYYLVMVSLAIGIYIIVWFVMTRTSIRRYINRLLLLFLVLGIAVLILSPSLFQYFEFSKAFPEVKRVIQDNIIYSASLLSYFTTARTTLSSRTVGFTNLSESDAGLFPGLVVLIGVGAAFIYGLKQKNTRTFILFFGILSLAFFIFSLGPFLKFTSSTTTSLALPYYYLYYLFFPLQIMRVPARFSIFAELFLILTASYGFSYMLKQLFVRKKQLIFSGCLFLVAITETWSVPMPITLVETKRDFPPVYYWLKDQPSETVILELPIPTNTLYSQGKNMNRHAFMQNLTIADRDNIEAYRNYFSLLHGKRMVNGYSAYAPPLYLEVVNDAAEFPKPSSVAALKKVGVDYLIIHTKQYFPDIRKNIYDALEYGNNMKIVEQFDDDIVIKIL